MSCVSHGLRSNAPHTPSCEHCGHPRAYLLVVPDLVETPAPKVGRPEVNVPALLKYDRPALLATLDAGLATPEHAAFVARLKGA